MKSVSIFVIRIRAIGGSVPAIFQMLSSKCDMNKSGIVFGSVLKECLISSQMVILWTMIFILSSCNEYMILRKFTTRHWSSEAAHSKGVTMPQHTHCQCQQRQTWRARSRDCGPSDFNRFRAMALFRYRWRFNNMDEFWNRWREMVCLYIIQMI